MRCISDDADDLGVVYIRTTTHFDALKWKIIDKFV